MDNTHGFEVVPPHTLPNQLRCCYRGVLTVEAAQAKLGDKFRVLEVLPAQCLSAGEISTAVLVDATEVIFARR